MLPRTPLRRVRSWLVAPLVVVLGAAVLSAPGGPATSASNPPTPGTFTGQGFDQCNAPSQAAMSAWRRSSPYRAAGIYISGNSRACRTQANLTPTWVSTQLAAGWKLLPITLGPQASCSTRFPRYGASIDPTINPSSSNGYAAAKAQGTNEAGKAVAAAGALGIVKGSTIFYDLEAFSLANTACKTSALWFVHAWTVRLHQLGYVSGFYSSAASGIKLLDTQRVTAGNPITLPDQIWIADWDGKANTSSTYVRSDGWQPASRVKQYRGGHNETWGGVTINIDTNYLALRQPGTAAPTPTPTPTTAPAPTTPPSSTRDPMCTTWSINRTAYRRTSATAGASLRVPLQCLLKQQHLYTSSVTGRWSSQTTTAMRAFQRRVHHPQRWAFTRSDWTSLLAAGGSGATLKAGTRGADVVMVQRALNAAGAWYVPVSGVYDARTAAAVGSYQRAVGIRATKVVAAQTWAALKAGRR